MDFDTATVILRLVVGSIFLAHGLQKMLGWFGGPGLKGTTQMMESLNMRPARLHAFSAATLETLGGTLLLLGFLMPVAAAAIVAVMVTAIQTVHFPKGFFNSNGGYEFNLTLIAVGLALACVGPGWLSIDHAIGLNWASWFWGLIALVAGTLGSVIAVSMGHHTAPHEEHSAAQST